MYSILNNFLKNQSGVFAIIFGIIIIPLFTLASFVMTSGLAVLEKNDTQNSADLAAVSASSGYVSDLFNGYSKADASQRAFKSMKDMFAYNMKNDMLDNMNYESAGDGKFKISTNGSQELVVKLDDIDAERLDFNVQTVVASNYEPGSSGGARESFEMSYIFDASGSMRTTGGTNTPAFQRLLKSAKNGYDILLDDLSALEKNDITVSQVIFDTDVTYKSPFSNDSETLKSQLQRNYKAGGSTNIHASLEEAIKLLEKNDFNRIGKKNNQIVVFMSDGRPHNRRVYRPNGGYYLQEWDSVEETEKEVDRIIDFCKDFHADGNFIISVYFKSSADDYSNFEIEQKMMSECQNGGYYVADNQETLDRAYQEIADRIKGGIKTQKPVFKRVRITQ